MKKKSFCKNIECGKKERIYRCKCGIYLCKKCAYIWNKNIYCVDCMQKKIINEINKSFGEDIKKCLAEKKERIESPVMQQ